MRLIQISAALAAATLLASAGAAEFQPNGLFVLTSEADAVFEIAATTSGAGADSALVRTFGDGTMLADASGCAFGPDGLLYVATTDPNNSPNGKILVFDPTGAVVGEIGADAPVAMNAPRGLAFGPNGHLYVASNGDNRVLEFDADGEFVRNVGVGSGLTKPTGLVVGPNGHVFVASADQGAIFEFIPGLGVGPVRTITAGGNLQDPQGLAFGPRGHLYCASRGAIDRVVEIDQEGNQVLQIGGLTMVDPGAVAVGPDGHLYVAVSGADRVQVFNGDETPAAGQTALEQIASIGGAFATTLDGPSALAFAPFRFGIELSGKMQRNNVAKGKAKEKYKKGSGPILTYAPGSRQISLLLVDGDDTGDLATLLGSDRFVLQGYLTTEDITSKFRSVAGQQFAEPSFDVGSATIVLAIKGKFDADGRYVPKELTGRFVRQARNVVFDGKVKLKKLLQ